jgi:hypothetical protein
VGLAGIAVGYLIEKAAGESDEMQVTVSLHRCERKVVRPNAQS